MNVKISDRVLLMGGSAGGVGTLLNIVRFSQSVNPGVEINALSDGGWFNMVEPYDKNIVPIQIRAELGYQLWNAKIMEECARDNGKGKESFCFSGPIIYPYIVKHVNISFFVLESLTDWWLVIDSGINQPINENKLKWLIDLKQKTLDSLKVVDYGFAPNCIIHTSLQSDDKFFRTSIDGDSMNEVISNWFMNKKGTKKIFDHCEKVDCNPSCKAWK